MLIDLARVVASHVDIFVYTILTATCLDEWSFYAGKGSGPTLLEWAKVAANDVGFKFDKNRYPVRSLVAVEQDTACQHLLSSMRVPSADGPLFCFCCRKI